MTGARTFRVTTSLADKMSRPGGRTAAAALTAATTALEGHREAAMQTLVETLEQLQALAAARDDAEYGQVYERAAALLDLAGFFETGPLYDAAYSLCETSDGMRDNGAWHWPSIEVHLQALGLILADDCRETEASRTLLEGLAGVRERRARRA